MRYTMPALLVFLLGALAHAGAGDIAKMNPLIVPGKSIGGIHLGSGPDPEGEAFMDRLGDPDGSDGALGGQASNVWYLGAHPGDKGRPFHRPGELGVYSVEDMGQNTYAHRGPVTTKNIFVSSPRFHTAGGIAPGSALKAIRAQFPGLRPDYAFYTEDNSPVQTRWPMFGEMEFYIDSKQGIAFSIRKSDDVCVEITVVPAGAKGTYHYPPLESWDYTLCQYPESLGNDIKPGMSATVALALLGKPDEKHNVRASAAGGEAVVWRWRLPVQNKHERPGLSILFQKLPGGMTAEQIQVSSAAFTLNGISIYPGSEWKDAGKKYRYTKLDGLKNDGIDVYGDLNAGFFFEVRQADSTCASITMLPPRDARAYMEALKNNPPPLRQK
ncbi:MAG TPA: hypothetical protein VG733_14490 [Chthoniobacteraceae bacterium]|nr:hypothetical protein [Chthoniobacteraceae bacterium]